MWEWQHRAETFHSACDYSGGGGVGWGWGGGGVSNGT